MKKLFLMLWLFLGVMACSNDNNSQIEKEVDEFSPVKLEMDNVVQSSVVLQNSTMGNHPYASRHLVIDHAADWQILSEQISMLQETVDFDAFTVIAVFDQPRTDLGCTIDITEVKEFKKHLQVTFDRLQKVGIAQMPSLPFHIVKIPKTDKQVVFTMVQE
ncbi:hypothetical protein [Flavobacterium sp. JP2137]|uniref:hypothetical protein n=1 Tax=Flavobacterium sp. JP2137 TaxID=3414510 RepID=UPI003D2FADDC